MNEYEYIGSELELFASADNYKKYVTELILPYIGKDVLEVGAGIGGFTSYLCKGSRNSWICIDPDFQHVEAIQRSLSKCLLPSYCEVRQATIDQLDEEDRFDTIIYLDVLEHIEDDKTELRTAATHLCRGGRLIVLAPAHQTFYSVFDKSIGHWRRYNKITLLELTPSDLAVEAVRYIDSVGILASIVNRWFWGKEMPTRRQVAIWDSLMVPCSRILDRMSGFYFGKTIIGIWCKK